MITLQPEVLRPSVRIVTRHSMRKGHHWVRTLSDFQLIFVEKGVLTLNQNDGHFRAGPGQLVLLWPGLPHDLGVEETGIMSTVHFDPISGANYEEGFYQFPSGQPSEFHLEDADLMEHLFNALWKSYRDHGLRHRLVLSHILASILCSLMRSEGDSHSGLHQHRMARLLGYIRNHLSERIDRHDLAKELKVTPQHVNYLIKKHFGVTVSSLIHRERAIEAHQLLSQGMSVGEAGRSVGYQDPFIFSREFKKHMGVAPRYAMGDKPNATVGDTLLKKTDSFFPQD